jgi:UDP-N-acetylglucosamine--N-acetylmuramyl-(pentapeptide) pyrophosphoryl-undecaprenol N-acetylglucosamine transferase
MHPKSPTIILAAGGTGGHIFPALALAEVLVERGLNPVFLTDARFHGYHPPELQGVLARMPIIEVATGRNGGGMLTRLRNLLGIVRGVIQAWRVMQKHTPALVIGFGGYPSLPTMLAAVLRGQRTMLHDQNAYLGRVNRLLARFVGSVALSYRDTHAVPSAAVKKTVYVGSPVRRAMQHIADALYPARSADAPLHVLVIGGSQGASVFSRLIPQAIALLPEQQRALLRVTQQCRASDIDAVAKQYAALNVACELAAFFPDIALRLTQAQLVISRAGASSVAELCVAGRPAIYVPLPSAMDNHQWYNAKAAADSEAAWLYEESTLTPEILAETLKRAITHPEILARMAEQAKQLASPQAAETLATLIQKEIGA